MWQKKYPKGNWEGLSEEVVVRCVSGCFHHPKRIINDVKNNPGKIIKTRFKELRYVVD